MAQEFTLPHLHDLESQVVSNTKFDAGTFV
jgi:hypothetical protein